MKKRSKAIIVYICVILAGLLGVAYANWTDLSKIISSITTARMDYDFNQSGNTLTKVGTYSSTAVPANVTVEDRKYLKIEIFDPSPIMSMVDGEILRINYILQDDEENVPLKAYEEDLGLICIDQSYVRWNVSNSELNAENFSGIVPDTLGTYHAYHRFKGLSGEIDLIPVDLPKPSASVIYINSKEVNELLDASELEALLSQRDKNQKDTVIILEDKAEDDLKKGESKKPNDTDDISVMTDDLSIASSDETAGDEVDSEFIEAEKPEKKNKKIVKKKVKKTKKTLLVNTDTISFIAEYSFTIPLKFDQYNVK